MAASPRICVLGAGVAGLSAAWFLRQRGYRGVTVLERADRVGGKCCSPPAAGRAVDAGAFLIPMGYPIVSGWVERFGLTTLPIPPTHSFDYTSTDPGGRSVSPLALAKYYRHLWRLRGCLERPGHTQLPEELCQPFTDWLAQRGLSALGETLRGVVTGYGYGELEQVPALYALLYMDRPTLTTITLGAAWGVVLTDGLGVENPIGRILAGGAQGLMESLAGELDDVRLGARVESITRSGGARVRWREGDGREREERFDALILAHGVGPGRQDFLDVATEERALFEQIRIRNYYTVVCDVPGFDHLAYVMDFQPGEDGSCLPTDGYPVSFRRAHADTDVVVAYACSATTATTAAIVDRVREAFSAMGREVTRVHSAHAWPYFPHVSSQALADGFYDRMEARQGQQDTYIAGALMSFESMERVATYSRHLVDRFFPPR